MESLNTRIITGISALLLSSALQAGPAIGGNDMRIKACAQAALEAATGKSDAGSFKLTNRSDAPENTTSYPDRYLRTEINLTVSGQRFACEVDGRGQVKKLTRLQLEESSLYATQ
ncbi:MAG: hypothetical protein HKO62_02475 [Gammaproteobacteria bacterium]|nr:hypothetical protein [Gammaproteobacteria bacterium]